MLESFIKTIFEQEVGVTVFKKLSAYGITMMSDLEEINENSIEQEIGISNEQWMKI
jgi:hypothetical protein